MEAPCKPMEAPCKHDYSRRRTLIEVEAPWKSLGTGSTMAVSMDVLDRRGDT